MSDEANSGQVFFGRYELAERIAIGRISEIFLATSHGVEGFRRTVVIKRLRQDIADEAFIKRYLQQIRLHCSLSHANIVQALDLGELDGEYYLTEEFVEGYDLAKLRDTAHSGNLVLNAPLGLFIVSELVKAVEYAHRRSAGNSLEPVRLAHCDLHPRNVLIGVQGEIKVADFGVFRPIEELDLSEKDGVLRAFGYASPEVAEGGWADPRSDFFSLGLHIVEVCSGVHPYADSTASRVRKNAKKGDVGEELLRSVPEPFREIVEAMLSKNPADRRVDLNLLYDRIVSYLHARHPDVGARALARFLEDVGDIELSTSVVYSGMLASQIGTGSFTSDPGLGAIEAVTTNDLWGVDGSGPPSGELFVLRLRDQAEELLESNGREEQLDLIVEASKKVGKGASQVVFVSGTRGSGKTHLLRVAHSKLNESGVRAFLIQPHSDSAAHPYSCMADLLSFITTGKDLSWGPDPGAELATGLERSKIGDSTTRAALKSLMNLQNTSMREARTSIGSLIQSTTECEKSALAVLIDSAELADVMSLELIHGALAASEKVPLLLVIASSNRGLLTQLGRAADESIRSTIVLPPLEEVAIRKLIGHITDEEVPDEAVRVAAGSPQLAVDQALRQKFGRAPSKRPERLDWLPLGLEPLPARILALLAATRIAIPSVSLARLVGDEAGTVHRVCRRLAGMHLLVELPVDHWSIGLRTVYEAFGGEPDHREQLRMTRRLATRLAGPGPGSVLRKPRAARLFANVGDLDRAESLAKEHASLLAFSGFTDLAINYLGSVARTMSGGRRHSSQAVRIRIEQVDHGLSAHRIARVREALGRLATQSAELKAEDAILQVMSQQLRLALRTGEEDGVADTIACLSVDASGSSSARSVGRVALALGEWHDFQGHLKRASKLYSDAVRAISVVRCSPQLGVAVVSRLGSCEIRRGTGETVLSLLSACPVEGRDIVAAQLKGLLALASGENESAAELLNEAFVAAHNAGLNDFCLRLAPWIVESLLVPDRAKEAASRLSEFSALARRLDSKPVENRLRSLTHALGALRNPKSLADQMTPLEASLKLADDAGRTGDTLYIAWLIAETERLVGKGRDATPRAVQLAASQGHYMRARRLG